MVHQIGGKKQWGIFQKIGKILICIFGYFNVNFLWYKYKIERTIASIFKAYIEIELGVTLSSLLANNSQIFYLYDINNITKS